MRFARIALTLLFLAPAIAAIVLLVVLTVKQFAAAADEGRHVVLWGGNQTKTPVARREGYAFGFGLRPGAAGGI